MNESLIEGGTINDVVTPIEVRVGKNESVKIEAGPESVIALRRDALRSLHDALVAIKDAEENMPAMDDGTVRGVLEEMSNGLWYATRSCDALWYLAPAAREEEGT